jgi:hypothetical protein
MTRFCDAMPCKRCHVLLVEMLVLLAIFGLTVAAKVMPLM